MTSSSVIKTYVINLETNKDRIDAVGRILETFGMTYTRVPAVDGRECEPTEFVDYDARRAQRYLGRNLVGAEIGCYRSHLSAVQQFLESDAQYGLILEDDALLLSNPVDIILRSITMLETVDKEWRLINAGAKNFKIGTKIGRISEKDFDTDLYAAHYFPMLAHALVWSRSGAREFIDNHQTIFAPVDNYFRYWLSRSGHGYAFWPAPVSTINMESQIYSKDGRKRSYQDRKWYYQLAKQKRLLEDKIIAHSARRHFKSKLSGMRAGKKQ